MSDWHILSSVDEFNPTTGKMFGYVKVTRQTWDEMNAEILQLREDNQKLREAVIRWRAIAEYGGNSEGQDYAQWFDKLDEIDLDSHPEYPDTWGKKDWLNDAEKNLRAGGVIK